MPILTAVALAAVAGLGAPAITADEITHHVRWLTDPKLEGRLTLEPGERKTAALLVDEFRRIGLNPAPNGDFIHRFNVTVNQRATRNNTLRLTGADGRTRSLSLGTEFAPIQGSTHQKEVSGRLVWLGYGIKADNWNDYAGIDLKGKVALMLRGVPTGREALTARQKAAWAAEAGAAAILFVGPNNPGDSDLPRPTRHGGIDPGSNLVAGGISSKLLPELVGMTWEQARAATAPASRELPVTVSKTTEMVANLGQGHNVIGYLPGNDPNLKDEFIIVGAHFDHLGYGEVGSRTRAEAIHPGADDNASGVAGVLALAEYFKMTGSNRRSMIFQLYSGEEVGLVGARAWVRDHPELIRRTSMMLNMDMIGRVREGRVTVFCTSSSKDFDTILPGIKVDGITLNPVPQVASNSDHAPFAAANVPVLFFHSGITEEYHTERDTLETLNIPGAVQVLDAVKQTLKAVDGRDQRLAWNPDAQRGARAGNQPRRVRIGFVPDMNASGPGVLLQGVSSGSPAEKAGLKAGDRVVELGGRAISSLEDMQAAMSQLRPGTAVKLIVVRNGERVEITLTPEG